MFKRFTYKEFTIILGIVVALIVVFALWIRQPSKSLSKTSQVEWRWDFHMLKDKTAKIYVSAFEELLSGRNSPY